MNAELSIWFQLHEALLCKLVDTLKAAGVIRELYYSVDQMTQKRIMAHLKSIISYIGADNKVKRNKVKQFMYLYLPIYLYIYIIIWQFFYEKAC